MNEHLFDEWEASVAPAPATTLITLPLKPGPSVNPCVALYGPGPDGKQCKDCAHLRRYSQSAVWFKCDRRKNTHGAKTDHRVRWPACARFELRKEEES